MSLDFSKRPSPALIVAVCALAFAMVGTAVAGTGAVNKITKSKVKTIAKKQADKELKANVSGSHVNEADHATNADKAKNADKATNADNATNATNAANAANANNAANLNGAPLVAGRIDGPTATVEAGSGQGLTNANVVRGSGFPTGVFCIGGLNPAPKNVIAQHANDTFELNISSEVGGDTAALCPTGFEQANIVVYGDETTLVNQDFHIFLY